MISKGWHSRGYLPHFDAKGVVQHVVFHTRTALSDTFLFKVAKPDVNNKRKLIDTALDASERGNVFHDARCALAMESQHRHFDGERYDLLAWCIMPNHVHVVLCCYGDMTLGQIVRTWKVQATVGINAALGTSGAIFAPDYFDRYMRNGQQTQRAIAYAENNPVAAGLCLETQQWRFSSARQRANGWLPKTENLPLSLY